MNSLIEGGSLMTHYLHNSNYTVSGGMCIAAPEALAFAFCYDLDLYSQARISHDSAFYHKFSVCHCSVKI